MLGNTQGEILRELLDAHFDKSSSLVGAVVGVNEDLQHLLKAFPGLRVYCIDCREQVYGERLVGCDRHPHLVQILPARQLLVHKEAVPDTCPKDFLDFVFIGIEKRGWMADCLCDYWPRVNVGGFISGVSRPDVLRSVSIMFESGVVTGGTSFWQKVKDKWIVVTGCTRSGTKYMTYVLQGVGVKVGHHKYLAEGTVSNYIAPCELPAGTILLHQVRHPLHSIGSQQTAQQYSWDYISKFISISLEGNLLLRCMRYWYYWNLLLEPKASFRYRVEDLENVWKSICDLVGIPLCEIPKVSKTTNTRIGQYSPVTWTDLYSCDSDLCDRIVEMAERYGYVL